ncbi:MAG: alkaline phosphatase family protein, partial [Bacilli bacterium]|nr:alkaline phosphatase family protein [Bacilli bacterium]
CKYPLETGWLGWTMYVNELGFPVECFPNRNALTKERLETPDYIESICPLKYIDEYLNEAGIKARRLYPMGVGGRSEGPADLNELMSETSSFLRNGGQFIYSYWPEPDHLIHDHGVDSPFVKDELKRISEAVEDFVKKNPDVLVLTIADHGLIDVEYVDLSSFPKIIACLDRPLSIEGRCVSFKIKEGMKNAFEKEFRKHFPDFSLLSQKEVLDSHYFGEGEANPRIKDFIGDYLAISRDNRLIYNPKDVVDPVVLFGHHAGGTPEEKNISLGIYNL